MFIKVNQINHGFLQVMDLLGAPDETDLVEMGLHHPGLFHTVGALTQRIEGWDLEFTKTFVFRSVSLPSGSSCQLMLILSADVHLVS